MVRCTPCETRALIQLLHRTAPILYHTVHLRTARHAQLFQRTTDHLIPSNPSFLATNVRYIVFDYCIDDIQDVFCILRACTGIIGLAHEAAIEPSPGYFILRLAELTEPCTRLTHLFLHIPRVLSRARLTLPCTLTHLSLNIDFRTLEVQSFWGPVRNHFPPLTHILIGMELPFYLTEQFMDGFVVMLRSWTLDLPSSFEVIVVRLIIPEDLTMTPTTMPDAAYHIASELRELPKVAILFSDTAEFELYDPLTLDSQHLPTIVYNGDPSVTWLNDDIWQVAESVLLSRRSLD